MKISVIIPAYNEESGISRSLEAVTSQDHPNFEVIVVDNASDDRTSDVARTFSSGRIPVHVVREERKGTMWACERGRAEATGDIIVRMDADCIPSKNWLSQAEKHFTNPRVVLVSGPYNFYESNVVFRYLSLAAQIVLYTFVNFLLQLFRLGALSNGGNTFLRASVLEKMGGFNTRLVFFGDDTDTAKRASRFGRVVFSPRMIMKTAAPMRRNGGHKKIYKYWLHFFKVIFSNS